MVRGVVLCGLLLSLIVSGSNVFTEKKVAIGDRLKALMDDNMTAPMETCGMYRYHIYV